MTEGKSPKRTLTEEAKEGKIGMTEQKVSDKKKSEIKMKVCRLTLSWTCCSLAW